MPIRPVNRMEPLPVDSPDDVAALIELAGRAATDKKLARGLTDHFGYLAGVHPEWLLPYQEVFITKLVTVVGPSFGDQCVLLAGAPDRYVAYMMDKLRQRWSFREAWALAAIGTEAALAAVAENVRAGADPAEYERLGVWVPMDGPAQYRFSPQRRAVFLRPVDDPAELARVAHPVGLPLDLVVHDPANTPVTWHYTSLRLAEVPGLPDWPAERVHLVSPRANGDWTLTARIDDAGRYRDETAVINWPPDAEQEDYFQFEERYGGPHGSLELRPFDADLVYCNGHIQLTEGVVGTAGGPPIGIYDNPHCPSCDRLMFHVLSVEHHVRDYGDGWRSLFICAECQIATGNATGWN